MPDKAKKIYNSLVKSLKEIEWNFSQNDEGLSTYSTMGTDDFPVDMYMKVFPELEIISLSSEIPFVIPEDKKINIIVAINLINAKINIGNFEYNDQNKKIVYRLSTSYIGLEEVTKELANSLIFAIGSIVDKYNDKFFMLIKGKLSLKDFE